MKLLFLIGMAFLTAGVLAKGWDGAGAPGGQQAGQSALAPEEGDAWQEGKPIGSASVHKYLLERISLSSFIITPLVEIEPMSRPR